MRWLIVALALIAGPAIAQDQPDPQVEVELDQTQIIPGQAATLRVTVLVPSWLPQPVEFPTFEAPNLRVRLPERATTSISRQIEGDTWSGVSRRYLLSPMVPGAITLPPQDMVITYADAAGKAATVTVQTGQIVIAGIIPKGAEGLDPFIAASDLVLTQDLSGPTTDLDPGSSVIRSVTASITGGSPIVLPKLGPAINIPGVKAYEDQPEITEQDNQGSLSGQRVERSTLMAIGGGSGTVPEIRLDWFDLDTNRVETAVVPGFDLSVTGPSAKADTPPRQWDWRRIALMLAALATLGLVIYRLLPRATHWTRQRRTLWLASEAHARKALLQQIHAKNYPGTMSALAAWRMKSPCISPACEQRIEASLLKISAPVFGQSSTQPNTDTPAWAGLAKAVYSAAHTVPDAQDPGLPSLNGPRDHAR